MANLNKLEKETGLRFEIGKFSIRQNSFMARLAMWVPSSDEHEEATAYEMVRKSYSLPPLNTEFFNGTDGSEKMKVVGYTNNSPSSPFIVERLKDSERFFSSISYLKMRLARKGKK